MSCLSAYRIWSVHPNEYLKEGFVVRPTNGIFSVNSTQIFLYWFSNQLIVESTTSWSQWAWVGWTLSHLTCFNPTLANLFLNIVNYALTAPIDHGIGTTRGGRLRVASLLVFTQHTKSPVERSSEYSTYTLFTCTSCRWITAVSEERPERISTPTDGEVEIVGISFRFVFRFNVSYSKSIQNSRHVVLIVSPIYMSKSANIVSL